MNAPVEIVDPSPTPIVDALMDTALREAAEQLGLPSDSYFWSAHQEAMQVERAIENLVEQERNVRQSVLRLMWRMERDLLYGELGHPSMLLWALSNPRLTGRWSKSTIERYASAITRILPAVARQPVVDPETGVLIDAETLLEVGTMSALADYSYTFSQEETTDEDRQEIVLSIVRHDGEETRDGLIRRIRSKRTPLPPVTVYTDYDADGIDFRGRCTQKQWDVITLLLGDLLEEHHIEPVEVAS